MVDTFPRQPRAGCNSNEARTVGHAGYTGVELRDYRTDCTSTAWFEVAQFDSAKRARSMRDALNEVFADPAADLEFIHITRLHSGAYAVVWPHVRWSQSHAFSTRVGQCSGGPNYRTFEELYKSTPFVLATVTSADTKRYGRRPWALAFLWANNIRGSVNGWNCTKDAMPSLVHGGVVPFLTTPGASWNTKPVSITATAYGYGECQPNFTTATTEIFHTMDLTVAVPPEQAGQARWARNRWVSVTFGDRAVAARLTDVCGVRKRVDLSRGAASYLRLGGAHDGKGKGKVTIGPPNRKGTS